MSWEYHEAMRYLLEALNRDILMEIRMAEECLQRADSLAQPYARLQSLLAHSAAAALSNATSLAAEVLALGAAPFACPPNVSGAQPGARSIEQYVFEAQAVIARYRKRLAMAERLGLARLAEVLHGIIATKKAHLMHAGVVAAADAHPKQLG